MLNWVIGRVAHSSLIMALLAVLSATPVLATSVCELVRQYENATIGADEKVIIASTALTKAQDKERAVADYIATARVAYAPIGNVLQEVSGLLPHKEDLKQDADRFAANLERIAQMTREAVNRGVHPLQAISEAFDEVNLVSDSVHQWFAMQWSICK
ncbi:MAG: hypothetical protein RIQ56_408 [Candidatus Parcubacteria bacterium]